MIAALVGAMLTPATGTAERESARACFTEEKPALKTLPLVPYRAVLKLERRVSHEGMVSIGGNLYSVPDILEAPWPRREEILLRDWFHDDAISGINKSRILVARILQNGLQPFNQPQLLPPIELADIPLVCWLGLMSEANISHTVQAQAP